MRASRLCFAASAALALAITATPHFASADCFPAVDPCCSGRPLYLDPNYTFGGAILVGTREVEAGTNACVTIFDLTAPYPGDGTNWAAINRYHGPGGSWDVNNLGSVFGLTVDKRGNIFVCQSTAYSIDFPGPGGNGAVYRIANGTGAITTFVNLPNASGAGLGNISYDCENDQYFVTNMEDGKIYRIAATTLNGPVGTILDSFDPLGPDDGSVGFAPLGERLWAVQWHAGRVYYSVWEEDCGNINAAAANTIRSVGLSGGTFDTGTDQFEIALPAIVNNYSMPVSDISFTSRGTMLTAERSMSGASSPAAHESRLLEWECGSTGLPTWGPSANTYVLGVSAACCCSGYFGNGTNCAGGVDADFAGYGAGTPVGRVWGTSDAMNGSLTVYGIQGLPPTGGTPAVSSWIDFDGSVSASEKTNLGDVEIPCKDAATATTLSMFQAVAVAEGIEVRWQFGDPGEVASVTLERAARSTGPWTEVTDAQVRSGDATVVVDRSAERGRSYWYQLSANLTNGAIQRFGPLNGATEAALSRFALSELTPNPTSGAVAFEFAVPRAARIRVSVVDVQGREIAVLADGQFAPGRYPSTWTAPSAKAAAVYFIRYRSPEGSSSKRLVVTP